MTDETDLGKAQRMQAALTPVLLIGEDFLAGRLDADAMAQTMVQSVRAFADAEQTGNAGGPTHGGAPHSPGRSPEEFQAALAEIYTCGSGYLADRCDADCVARTMVQIMHEFGDPASVR